MLMGASDWIITSVDDDTKRAFGLCEAAYAAHKLDENNSESLLSFERNVDICLQRGYQFIRVVGGKFRWIPADAQMPPDESTTTATRVDLDAVVLTPMHGYEGDVVRARNLTILIDLAERKDGCCRAMENGTQNKPRNMYTLCSKTNVDSKGLCAHSAEKTQKSGRAATPVHSWANIYIVANHTAEMACFYQFLDNRSCSSLVDFARSAYFYNFFIRVPSPSRTSVPLCSDSTSLMTSVSHCHDTLWDDQPKRRKNLCMNNPANASGGAIGSRGASGGGPGEIMISKTSSSVRLSVQFDHSISF